MNLDSVDVDVPGSPEVTVRLGLAVEVGRPVRATTALGLTRRTARPDEVARRS